MPEPPAWSALLVISKHPAEAGNSFLPFTSSAEAIAVARCLMLAIAFLY
ncbi:MAG: hypothetical protein AAFQ89_14660 [Cyanobacteria bacterium J06626_18]